MRATVEYTHTHSLPPSQLTQRVNIIRDLRKLWMSGERSGWESWRGGGGEEIRRHEEVYLRSWLLAVFTFRPQFLHVELKLILNVNQAWTGLQEHRNIISQQPLPADWVLTVKLRLWNAKLNQSGNQSKYTSVCDLCLVACIHNRALGLCVECRADSLSAGQRKSKR